MEATPAGPSSLPRLNAYRIRVKVSGEPFDIPSDELEERGGASLRALAARAPTADGAPTLSFARDVRAFRVIRHYLATGALLVPPDPIEREILRTELDFYGLRGGPGVGDTLIPAPALQFYAPAPAVPPPPPGAVPPAPARGEPSAAQPRPPPEPGGWALPGPHEVARLLQRRGGPPAAEWEAPPPYWVQGPTSDFPRHAEYSPEDAAARAAELGARRIFGEGGDGTAEVALVALPEPSGPEPSSPEPSGPEPSGPEPSSPGGRGG